MLTKRLASGWLWLAVSLAIPMTEGLSWADGGAAVSAAGAASGGVGVQHQGRKRRRKKVYRSIRVRGKQNLGSATYVGPSTSNH